MDLTSTFAPIAKYTDQDDGSLMVYGKATDGGLDLDDQRCDPNWLSTAMPEWFSSAGNIRAQHRADSAVGKATEHTFDADGHYITARIVDREAIAKTKAGVFTGFSIGIRRPKIVKSPMAPNGLINGGQITEVSLCDRPANPACTLMLCKSASEGWEGRQSDFDPERGLVKCEDLNFFPENEIRIKTVAEPIRVETNLGGDFALEAAKAANPGADVVGVIRTKSTATTEAEAQKAADAVLELAKGAADEVVIQVNAALTPEQLAEFASKFGPEAGDGVAEANKALGQSEAGDISGADSAIASIAQLIISEAKDLAKMPSQDCDIHLLMSAVDALRCFARREQMEQAGTDPDRAIYLADGAKGAPNTTKAENVSDTKVTLDGQDMAVVPTDAPKSAGADDVTPETPDAPDAEKSDTPDEVVEPAGTAPVTKAADEAPAPTDPDVLVKALNGALTEDGSLLVKAFSDAFDEDESPLMKALSGALAKEGSPLSKMIAGIVEASAKTTAKSLDSFSERLVQVEAMATPGGPALRRTESERNTARKSDLAFEAARYKALATHTEDHDLRKGYAIKAAQLESEIKTLA